MKPYVALFRGINVGGKNSLPMATLVSLLTDLGCRGVRTYIQSGNAVFESEVQDAGELAQAIRAAIGERCGFEPALFLLEPQDIEGAIRGNPFPEAEGDPQSLHVGFLAAVPSSPDLAGLESLRKDSERFHLTGRLFYLHAPEGVGRSKLAAAAERLLGVPVTDRNWRTVCKICDMLKMLPG